MCPLKIFWIVVDAQRILNSCSFSARIRAALRAVLHDQAPPAGRLPKEPRLAQVVAAGLLDVDVLAGVAGENRCRSVPVVRGGHDHRVDAGIVEDPPEVGAAIGGGKLGRRLPTPGGVGIHDRGDPDPRHLRHRPRDRPALGAAPDQADGHGRCPIGCMRRVAGGRENRGRRGRSREKSAAGAGCGAGHGLSRERGVAASSLIVAVAVAGGTAGASQMATIPSAYTRPRIDPTRG